MSRIPQPNLSHDEKPISFLFENSLFLILGTVAAIFWANWSDASLRTYDHFFHRFQLKEMFIDIPLDQKPDPNGNHSLHDQSEQSTGETVDARQLEAGQLEQEAAENFEDWNSEADATIQPLKKRISIFQHPLTWEFIINDILMAFFFAIAAKEVWESLLPGGALHNPRAAAMPLVATLGGLIGPILVYLAGCLAIGGWEAYSQGWAIPCATDIAFSYLVARIIFGAGHPVIAFLLLLAIADDAAGLAILAVFYPTDAIDVNQLWLVGGAMLMAYLLTRMKVHSFWWYLAIPGTMCWLGFYWAHLHPALALVPIIPFMPHAGTDLGTFATAELQRHDTLSEFEAWWKNPVELILGLFGLANAGVALSSMGSGTWLILGGLLIGKPVGIVAFTILGQKYLRLKLPDGIRIQDVLVLGIIASIGFTVALFMSTAAFAPSDPVLPAVKMGALFSFVAAIIAWLVARMVKVKRVPA